MSSKCNRSKEKGTVTKAESLCVRGMEISIRFYQEPITWAPDSIYEIKDMLLGF